MELRSLMHAGEDAWVLERLVEALEREPHLAAYVLGHARSVGFDGVSWSDWGTLREAELGAPSPWWLPEPRG